MRGKSVKFGQQSEVTTVSVELFRLPRPHSTSKRRLPHNIHNTCKRNFRKILDKYSFFMFLRMEGGSEEVRERSYSEDEPANNVTLAIGEHSDPSTEESGEREVSTENVEDTKCETEEEQQSLVSSSEVGIFFNHVIFQIKKDLSEKIFFRPGADVACFFHRRERLSTRLAGTCRWPQSLRMLTKTLLPKKYKPPSIITINSIDY